MPKSKGRNLFEEGLACGCLIVVFALAFIGAVALIERTGWHR